MTRLLALAVLLSACGEDTTRFPPNPGGGGGTGGTSTPDASAGDGDASATIAGRVCLISDPRQPTACATSGAGNFTVSLGTLQATTAADGTFEIMRPPGTGLVWTVTGAGIETSVMRLGSVATIPALPTVVYDDMLAAMNAVVIGGNGAIIAQVKRMGTPLANAVATVAPTPDSEIYYDGQSIIDWDVDQTGSFGAIWISSLQSGTASLSVETATVQGGLTGIPVVGDAITFVLFEIP